MSRTEKEFGRFPCREPDCSRVFLTNVALFGHYSQSGCHGGDRDE